MADNRKSYNAVLRALKRSHGLNQAQARVAWKGLKDRLERTPRAADLKKHPRITAQEIKRAPARERALRAAKTRAANKAKARTAPIKPAPKPERPRERAAAAAAGAGGGAREIPPEFEDLNEFYAGEEFDERRADDPGESE
jgi:hypothetical protein